MPAKSISAAQPAEGMSGFETIDTIRFFAICSIIWGHCGLEFDTHVFPDAFEQYLQSVVLQLGKFGTIFFFLISGFLIQPRLHTYNTVFFLKSRLRSTILPWAIFVALFCLLQMTVDLPLRNDIVQGHMQHAYIIAKEIIRQVVLYYAYWFMLVFLFSAILLINLRKYVYSRSIGILFASFTAFYAANLHAQWIDAHHVKAFMGYIFVMWVGLQLRVQYESFMKWLDRLSWPILLTGYTLTFWWACAEGMALVQKGSVDPYASNRISNICNAFIAFACLYKWGKVSWVNKLQPRRIVYGMFLLHVVILFIMVIYGNKLIGQMLPHLSATGLLETMIAEFLFTTITCYLLVYTFQRWRGRVTPLIQ